MADKASFSLKNRNPDVLTSIANLSNDEVFTPPSFANQMLDTIEEAWAKDNKGSSIWEDKTVTFLDPFTKSGVFLREITRRLSKGLEKEIPDVQERVNHILTKQVFGLAITQLTALLARRSVYCSKFANGKHSICTDFDSQEGNIWFERKEHTWVGGKYKVITVDDHGNEIEKTLDGSCKYCRAKQQEYERGPEAESHAYPLIHTEDPKAWIKETFGEDMQFDVIVGNPPYQLSDGGFGSSAGPIYDKFIRQAIALEPRFLSMVVPSRWFTGGKGLDRFRDEMLTDRRLRRIVDYVVAGDAFPSVKNLNGGVNYFLWERDSEGDCEVTIVEAGPVFTNPTSRLLDEFDIFIRREISASIVRTVLEQSERFFDTRVSALKPFGLRTNFHGSPTKTEKKDILFHGSGKKTWISLDEVESNADWVDQWKVLIPRASDGNEIYPLPIWDSIGPIVSGPGEACSETYLVAYVCDSKDVAQKIAQYMRTKFFRFLVWTRKTTQHNKADLFKFVPDLQPSKPFLDTDLYQKFSLSNEQVEFIERMIRPMEPKND